MGTSEREWAREQFERIEPTQTAVLAFDASEDGQRYREITGMSMWTNLGGNSLPSTAESE
jgi:hypothetical protein